MAYIENIPYNTRYDQQPLILSHSATFTAGVANGFVFNDSGPLPAGDYIVVTNGQIADGAMTTFIQSYVIAHRNATNTADLSLFNVSPAQNQSFSQTFFRLHANERIITRKLGASAPGTFWQISLYIWR